jgi:hypothetical protein
MVSVLEGQLTRTWTHVEKGKKHTINLYHDTITGVRSAMLDFEEIPDSIGNSSLLMGSAGHRITFFIDGVMSCIDIKKSGWTEFAYACYVNGTLLKKPLKQSLKIKGPNYFAQLLKKPH